MIFQNLIAYYDRLAEAGEDIPALGFSSEELGFSITLSRSGKLVGEPRDLRNKLAANKYEYRLSEVPYTNGVNVRSGKGAEKTPNFMADKADYIFGMSGNTAKPVHKKSFTELVEKIAGESDDPGVLAVKAFLAAWNPANSPELPLWDEICGTHGKWIAFELEGEMGFVHERPAVMALWQQYLEQKKYRQGISLVTGSSGNLQEQYAQFKFGSGASLVSFNENAYESYNKKRGDNAPIHVIDEFKSSTALKYLFRSKKQRLTIGDAVTVFWTERVSPVEAFMSFVLNPQPGDDAADNQKISQFLRAAKKGKTPDWQDYEGDVRFYILGFSLNKARLALRFRHDCSVDELKDRIGEHFRCLEMETSSERDMENPGIWHLLKETARETKDISPLLGGALMRSILEGRNYPLNLYNGVLGRIRADQRITYLRAAILKAVLTRNYENKLEVPMSLDEQKHDAAYLLGRLFAVLEKAQLDALGKVNATIKDRFYGAASATPATVFPRLLRLAQHHIAKAEYGYISDKNIAKIMENITAFPSHLDLQGQGLFAIGYYQQKNALYRKRSKGEENE
ncbi:CRISPR-associated protein Csd1 [Candidatus Electrothrix aarhusensis]|uniref:CRISPR-associated protein Csd1 n=1 Tax=Candidatus Electrothrix aarhusensis TaxID=1859131 RepID=A0A3S3QFH7_9BACT|nr:CRISPR-associated protein Csd1 [Candidatus Electrothrix aarhusensis]